LLIFEKQQTLAPLVLTLEQENIGGLLGKVPMIGIRDATSLDSYLDFAGFTFKSSGWTEKYEPMSEVERGHYTYLLSLSAIAALDIGAILSIEYSYEDGGIIRVDQETMIVVESIAAIPTDTATLIGVTGGVLTPAQAAQLKETWQILGLDAANPMVVSTTSRTVDTVSQTIQKDVPLAGHITVTRL
jgi:hypothetical protein